MGHLVIGVISNWHVVLRCLRNKQALRQDEHGEDGGRGEEHGARPR
jgi:hypothetical protein